MLKGTTRCLRRRYSSLTPGLGQTGRPTQTGRVDGQAPTTHQAEAAERGEHAGETARGRQSGKLAKGSGTGRASERVGSAGAHRRGENTEGPGRAPLSPGCRGARRGLSARASTRMTSLGINVPAPQGGDLRLGRAT